MRRAALLSTEISEIKAYLAFRTLNLLAHIRLQCGHSEGIPSRRHLQVENIAFPISAVANALVMIDGGPSILEILQFGHFDDLLDPGTTVANFILVGLEPGNLLLQQGKNLR